MQGKYHATDMDGKCLMIVNLLLLLLLLSLSISDCSNSISISNSNSNIKRIDVVSRITKWLGVTAVTPSLGTSRDRQHEHNDYKWCEYEKDMDGNTRIGSRYRRRRLIPPSLLFLLSSLSLPSKGSASPLNPQTISLSGPFFQGWLMRTVDHRVNTSFILIVGSFANNSKKRKLNHKQNDRDRVDQERQEYDEHYIFCGVCMADGTSRHFHALPRSEDVTITGGKTSSLSLPFPHENELNITWDAKGYGKFEFNTNECNAFFHFEDNEDDGTLLDLRMKVVGREPWNRGNSLAGPEGWLGYTTLLPCHYYVHTTCSNCEYDLIYTKRRGKREVVTSSTGLTHMEGNYGTFFPKGWTWAQGVSAPSSASSSESFSLVGGLFVIGGIQPVNWVIYIRAQDKHWEFRTTGGSQIKYRVSSSSGSVEVNATTPFRNQRLHMTIRSKNASPVDFSPAIYIPTAEGFSNKPGCRETYTAFATATIYDSQDAIVKEMTFDLSALEFGGSFQGVDLEATRTLID